MSDVARPQLTCDGCHTASPKHEFVVITEGRSATAKLLCTDCLVEHLFFAKKAMVTVIVREGKD